MANLYEIQRDLVELIDRGFNEECINEDGEIDEEKVAALIDGLEMAKKDKIEAIACFIKNLESDAAELKAEEQNLKARRESKERKAENLKTYLQNALIYDGTMKFETAKCALSFRKSEQVIITNQDILPKEFIVAKTTYAPDKTALKNAIKAGEIIDGVVLETKQNLQIK